MLAPGGNKSLDSLGKLYGEGFGKIKLTTDELSNMDKTLEKDPERFKQYAVQDAVITLIHACFMEDFYFKLGKVNIPLTLSQISTAFIEAY